MQKCIWHIDSEDLTWQSGIPAMGFRAGSPGVIAGGGEDDTEA